MMLTSRKLTESRTELMPDPRKVKTGPKLVNAGFLFERRSDAVGAFKLRLLRVPKFSRSLL